MQDVAGRAAELGAAPGWVGRELALVVPTLNESANVPVLVERLHAALDGVEWEVLFVDDDSRDGTADVVRRIAQADPRVRCLHRIGRRGLASACIEGILATSAPIVAVMDADLQHDEKLLPAMVDVLRKEPVDLVVGSRFADGGGVGEWDDERQRISRIATGLGRMALKVDLSDPMSGFFMIRRSAFEPVVYKLSLIGFKLLLDIVVSSPTPLRVRELPYRFSTRVHGDSKLDSRVAWDYLMLLADKTIGRWIPARLVSFALIGSFGVLVHLTVLRLGLAWLNADFVDAQAAAVVVAMVGNFLLNNMLTYRDRRLQGWAMLGGLLKFMAACGLGAVANVGVAAYIHAGHVGWLLSSLAGIIVGTVWNYVATAYLVWLNPRR